MTQSWREDADGNLWNCLDFSLLLLQKTVIQFKGLLMLHHFNFKKAERKLPKFDTLYFTDWFAIKISSLLLFVNSRLLLGATGSFQLLCSF